MTNKLGLEEQKRLVEASGFFDPIWYANKYPDVNRRGVDALTHYVTLGGRVGYQPGPDFDVLEYMKKFPELRYNRVPALVHYMTAKNPIHAAPTKSASVAHGPFQGKTILDLKTDQFTQGIERPGELFSHEGTISAVIPTCGKNPALLDKCLASLHPDTEVILVVNGKNKDALKAQYEGRCNVLVLQGSFNWSVANNLGAKKATGEYVLFLNDDLYGDTQGWERELLSFFLDPRVHLVAPVLLNPDGSVQSAGCYRVPQGCTSAHVTFAPVRSRFVESVMGAAFMVRRDVALYTPFDTDYKLIMAETDFCMRVGGCVVAHDVRVTHHERSSRGNNDPQEDIQRFLSRHPLPSATYLSSHWLPVGGTQAPLRVLVMKLDHIGDATLAKAAVERWVSGFPSGFINVDWLVNPVAKSLFPGAHTYLYFEEKANAGVARQAPGAWENFVRSLPDYDLVVDLRAHGCTSGLLRAWENKGTLTFAFGKDGYPDYNHANPKKAIHNQQALSALLASLPLYVQAPECAAEAIVLCRASSSIVKAWPENNWAALVGRLRAFGLPVIEVVPPGMQPLSGTDETVSIPLDGLAAYAMGHARLWVGQDSGPTHIVAQAGVPVVEIMGGLVSQHEWMGVGNTLALTAPQRCSPCYMQPCKMGSPVCIQSIGPDEVTYAVRQMFREGRA